MSSISSFLTSIHFKFQELFVWSIPLLLLFLSIENSQSVEIVPAIVGGKDADVTEYPFVVSILKNLTHYCGGSIVNHRFILTSGHCIVNQTRKSLHVLVESKTRNGVLRQLLFVEDIRVHPRFYYTGRNIKNDIGVLKLIQSITYGPTTTPVFLSRNVVQPGTHAVVIGWGRTQFHEKPSNRLQQLDVVTISQFRCKILAPYVILNSGNLCTEPKWGHGACYGDSGSPLVESSNHYNQIGLLSWIHRTCGGYQPDGYTRISQYVDWIQNVTSDTS